MGLAVIPALQCSSTPDSFILSFKSCLQEPILKLSLPDRNRIGINRPRTPQDNRLREDASLELLAGSFELGTNSPNPFHDYTKVPIYAPYPSVVSLHLYDVMGRQVKMLELNLEKGWSEVQISALDVPQSGMYSLVLKTSKSTLSRKVVFVKE